MIGAPHAKEESEVEKERKIMNNVNDDQATSKRERIEGDGDGWIDRCSSCRGG